MMTPWSQVPTTWVSGSPASMDTQHWDPRFRVQLRHSWFCTSIMELLRVQYPHQVFEDPVWDKTKNLFGHSHQLRWCQDNRNRFNQEDFLATRENCRRTTKNKNRPHQPTTKFTGFLPIIFLPLLAPPYLYALFLRETVISHHTLHLNKQFISLLWLQLSENGWFIFLLFISHLSAYRNVMECMSGPFCTHTTESSKFEQSLIKIET